MHADDVARWDGKSTHYAQPGGWNTLGSGTDGTIYTAQVIGTDLYIGGLFQRAGGKESSHIGRWSIPQTEDAAGSRPGDRAAMRLAGASPASHASPASPSRLMLGPATAIGQPVRVYDVAGRCVRTILADDRAPIAPGVYFMRAGEGAGAASYRVVVLD
jgi:hypothetical protein